MKVSNAKSNFCRISINLRFKHLLHIIINIYKDVNSKNDNSKTTTNK